MNACEMSEDEFLASMKCEPVPALDVNGNPIEKLEGLYFKPLGVDDTLAIHAYTEKHGKDFAWRMMFVRSLTRPDGTRILSDEAADKLGEVLAGPIGKAVPRIRQISGELEDAGEQKKTGTITAPSLTNGLKSDSSFVSPVT